MHDGSLTGAKRVEWTYGTVSGGIGIAASSIRYDGGNAYKSAIDGYDDGGWETYRNIVTIPVSLEASSGIDRGHASFVALVQRNCMPMFKDLGVLFEESTWMTF